MVKIGEEIMTEDHVIARLKEREQLRTDRETAKRTGRDGHRRGRRQAESEAPCRPCSDEETVEHSSPLDSDVRSAPFCD